MTLFCLVLFLLCNILNVCRNISDGVSPFIPPCSLLSLYAMTNISYLCFPSSMLDMTSTEMNSFFTILLYASIFPWQLGIRIWNRFIFYVVMLKKAFKDFGCKLFTIVMQDFLGLSINHNPLFSTSRTSILLFLSEYLLVTCSRVVIYTDLRYRF